MLVLISMKLSQSAKIKATTASTNFLTVLKLLLWNFNVREMRLQKDAANLVEQLNQRERDQTANRALIQFKIAILLLRITLVILNLEPQLVLHL